VATEHLNVIGCGPREDYLGEGSVKQTIVGSVSQFDNPGIDQIAQALDPKRISAMEREVSGELLYTRAKLLDQHRSAISDYRYLAETNGDPDLCRQPGACWMT
jgi:hypothetical protein